MKKHMQAATTAHLIKMNMGGVSLLLFKTVVFLATMFSATAIVAQPTLPETNIWNLPGITNMHDVVINCDMLEHPNSDEGSGTVKAIVWDNGERYQTTGNQAESWLYFEDHLGFTQTISMGIDIKQPDVVIANHIDPFDGATPDYIVAVVYVEEFATGNPLTDYTSGYVYLRTYGVYNVGTAGLTITLLTQNQLGTLPSYTAHGAEDGNPHIDMWTNASTLVRGLPGLREFAVCWSEGYSFTNCLTPPAVSNYTTTPGRLWYTWGDINAPTTGVTNRVSTGYSCNGMSDIACYYDVEQMQQFSAITFGGSVPCTSKQGLYVNQDIPKATISFPAGSVVALNATDDPKVARIEAMSQYDQSSGTVSKWVVAASMPQSGGGFPWEVWGYDDLSNLNILSTNFAGTNADVVSPAVAAGIGPVFNSNIGNTQYTTGYYPRDYNNPSFNFHIWSRSVDVYTGLMSASELQVDNNAVNYNWDINRIYAVSNSSNSGLNILSAYHDGTDIIYKESPNFFAYKQGNTTTVANITNHQRVWVYPNPASDKIYLNSGENVSYHITDVTGKVVLTGTYDAKGIDVKKLSTGFYIVKMKDAHNKPSSFKFVKQ